MLQKVWAASGGQCGRYLAASMALQLDALERHGELVDGRDRYGPAVRAELLAMSSATIDRYLRGAKARDQISGVSTTKPSPLLRSSITICKAGDEAEESPGFFEGDTVAHCGPTLKGEFARTVNLTDMHIGWVFTRTVRNNAHPHILGALKTGITKIPYKVTGLDFDNGTEFLNKAVIKWAADMEIFFTRSRPYKKNDQATIESKNNHLVRRYGFYYRYDTDEERAVLNRLWHLVNDRLNYLTPTIKPISYGCSRDGHRRRLYDKPQTPWTGCWPPESSQRPNKQSCSPTATASTPPRSPARSPTCKPPCSDSPKTRPNSSTSPPYPPLYPPSKPASASKARPPPDPDFAGIPYVMHEPGFAGILT
ncbi:transposase [Mycobacterium shottsii]|nr:transposase [Mycobacterium shottsii]QYL27248.1 transposase [Mycobacterium shottsii]